MVEKETSLQKITRLTSQQKSIRNVATSAHIHHGKTAFTDNLLAAAGMMASKNAGSLEEGMTTWQHSISDNILRQQANDNGLIDVNGKLRGRNTFKKSILCKRHNEGLSPLDEIGGRFFKTICDIDIALNKLNYDSVPDVSEFDGQDLERYMLKELFGCLSGQF
jgi:hypothetical protein